MPALKIDKTKPNLVTDGNGHVIGFATKWNPHGFGECIVQFLDGSADSAMFNETYFLNGSEAARDYLNSKEL